MDSQTPTWRPARRFSEIYTLAHECERHSLEWESHPLSQFAALSSHSLSRSFSCPAEKWLHWPMGSIHADEPTHPWRGVRRSRLAEGDLLEEKISGIKSWIRNGAAWSFKQERERKLCALLNFSREISGQTNYWMVDRVSFRVGWETFMNGSSKKPESNFGDLLSGTPVHFTF